MKFYFLLLFRYDYYFKNILFTQWLTNVINYLYYYNCINTLIFKYISRNVGTIHQHQHIQYLNYTSFALIYILYYFLLYKKKNNNNFVNFCKPYYSNLWLRFDY